MSGLDHLIMYFTWILFTTAVYLLPRFDPCFMLTLSFCLPIPRILVSSFSQPLPWSLDIPTFLFFSTGPLFVPWTPHLFLLPLFFFLYSPHLEIFFFLSFSLPSSLLSQKFPLPLLHSPDRGRSVFKRPEEGQPVTPFCFHRLTFVLHKSSNPRAKKSQTSRNV